MPIIETWVTMVGDGTDCCRSGRTVRSIQAGWSVAAGGGWGTYILIVCSPFPVPKTICFSTPFTKLLAWYPEESRSHFEENLNQYLEFMR